LDKKWQLFENKNNIRELRAELSKKMRINGSN